MRQVSDLWFFALFWKSLNWTGWIPAKLPQIYAPKFKNGSFWIVHIISSQKSRFENLTLWRCKRGKFWTCDFSHFFENLLRGDPPPKNEKKSLFQFLLNLKLENICELMQKTASPYLFPFQNYGRMKLTCTDILLYKNGHFLRQIRV